MDTSETYIKMCGKAKLDHFWKEGDFYYVPERSILQKFREIWGKVLVFRKEEVSYKEWHQVIWLPRQDQLQEMIPRITDVRCLVLPKLLCEFVYYNHSSVCNTAKQFTSMEQLWLAFMMKEKYNKVWTRQEWEEASQK